ncbi:GNAT family N-acetyltransferase [Streptomyces sp. AM 2-1-1]|uniref:GNAT family N-acetyltransferase n=1 Tax=Streptomyces sp. AM 2-1-1 TaxID=3028709 RepID=UPI0023B96FEE|nr:GNAT family N-acetyltransferase [Streptomyces sp. AM 2-1-1]WEH39455.1 GNAT family N-acetyltransferase [Streptomyces sp. AM 2-1-1]
MRITTAVPEDLDHLLAFRKEAASWISELGSDQWSRPYPADRLLATIDARTVFMVRDGERTAATITLTPEAEEGLWSDEELREASLFVNKLTVSRDYAGTNLGGKILDWAGDRAAQASAKWLRLDAWTSNVALQRYYIRQNFQHVRTVLEGGAVNGGPRVSGWLAQRAAHPSAHGFVDETPRPEPVHS